MLVEFILFDEIITDADYIGCDSCRDDVTIDCHDCEQYQEMKND